MLNHLHLKSHLLESLDKSKNSKRPKSTNEWDGGNANQNEMKSRLAGVTKKEFVSVSKALSELSLRTKEVTNFESPRSSESTKSNYSLFNVIDTELCYGFSDVIFKQEESDNQKHVPPKSGIYPSPEPRKTSSSGLFDFEGDLLVSIYQKNSAQSCRGYYVNRRLTLMNKETSKLEATLLVTGCTKVRLDIESHSFTIVSRPWEFAIFMQAPSKLQMLCWVSKITAGILDAEAQNSNTRIKSGSKCAQK